MQWQRLYESCDLARNLERLNQLVFQAEDAIYLRSRELSNESNISAEVQPLRRAAKGLLEIKIQKLGWPDPARVKSSNPETNRRTLTDEQRLTKKWVLKSSKRKTSQSCGA